jgi:MinD-like ATPase involved in chromosome partitioning or flagellar assembly
MIRVEITSDTSALASSPTGQPVTLEANAGADIQQRVIDYVTTTARRDGQELTVEIIETPENPPVHLLVTPQGEVREADKTPPPAAESAQSEEQTSDSHPVPEAHTTDEFEDPNSAASSLPSEEAEQQEPGQESSNYPSRKSLRDTTFLVTEIQSAPATKGWRGTLNKLGFRLEPSEEETAEREDIRAVSQHWPGPRTIAVVNRKGGANKTPTVAMLSAVLARYGGGPVIAWDNNESQGTLGWRTEQGAHKSSVLHLIAAADKLLSPSANAADLAHYVHHQTADKFDVLRSDENDEGDHEITAEEVDIAHRVLSKFYRLLVMDSGNTARSANWRRMIDHTSQLVVPVTAMEDRAEAARLTLQTLESRGGHNAELAHNAVVIVSEATDAARGTGDALKRSREEAARIAEGFKPLVRQVVRVPYDPALVNGIIRYDALRPATQRAWLAAAAAVTQGF